MNTALFYKWHFLFITFISGVFFLLCSFSFDIFQYGDNCGYMTLGIAFAEGKGFIDPALPGSHHFLWWPPGFPLFIALFYKVLGAQWNVLKILIIVILYTSFTLYAINLYNREKKLIKALSIHLALCFSSGIHLLSSYLYSETFFIACSLIFFFIWYKWKVNLTPWKIAILSTFAVYIGSIRLIGMSLPVALILYLLIFTGGKKQLKWYSLMPCILLISYIIISLFVPAWKVDSFRSAAGLKSQFKSIITGAYTGEPVTLSFTLSRYINKASQFIRGYGLSLIPQALIRSTYDLYAMNKLKAALMAIVTAVIFTGWCITFRNNRLMNLYVFFFMLVLFIYGPHYVRLTVPIIPFLFLYFYSGLEVIIKFLIKKEHITIVVLTVLWVGVISDNVLRTFTDPHRTMPPQFGDNKFQACLEWVANNAKPKEVVVSQVHSYLYLKRGQYCIPYFGVKAANEFITYLDENNVKYIVVSPFYQRPHYTYMNSTREAVVVYPDNFKMVFGDDINQSCVIEYIPEI